MIGIDSDIVIKFEIVNNAVIILLKSIIALPVGIRVVRLVRPLCTYESNGRRPSVRLSVPWSYSRKPSKIDL